MTIFAALIRLILLYRFPCFCNAQEYVLKELKRVERCVYRIIDLDRTDLMPKIYLFLRQADEAYKGDKLRELFDTNTPTSRSSNLLETPHNTKSQARRRSL